jgi:multicomponent Na+:H+ antiporter subunit B
MNGPFRLTIFFLGALGIGLLWIAASLHLPGPADLRDRYLQMLDARTFQERHITDLVSAVNFDIRGFDTMGEEFILFASVFGALVLLRQSHEKRGRQLPDALTPSRDVPSTDAVRLWILAMVGPKIAFGIYIVIHGQLTPGGGFQGGVIIASATLIIYLGENFETFKRLMTHTLVEIAEATGAAAFILLGSFACFKGQPFLTNIFPLGQPGSLSSGGTVPWISAATGLEVTGGFVILLYAFLQETLTREEDQ